MPTNVEIGIFNIARTMVDRSEVDKWLRHIGVSEDFKPPHISDPALLIALAAKRCYMSFEPGLNPNVTRVRQNYTDYFDNILKSGHGSVLEHASYSYAVEGVSRVFTGEQNRHHAGWATSEGSQRFIRFDKDIPYWMPLSLRENPDDDEDLAGRKEASRTIFNNVFRQVEESYADLLFLWEMEELDKNFDYKKRVTSCLRRIVPIGVATGGIWTGNIRALRHVIALRTEEAAEEEIAHVYTRIADDIIKREPMLFQDFGAVPGGGYKPAYWKV